MSSSSLLPTVGCPPPATVPTPEQTYAAMAPDMKRKVDANRAARLAREQATQRQMAAQGDDSDAPVWADTPPRK
ncbi:hypothetical protein OE88DRAFT_1732481 [Heliocybe sulcata]|uniref:Uncharacterized protein n=1 Tax=Heliocybe sulcata TaxID=5364 RepID=A0A5C3NC19_9AGAM|nr:hypothetical protein OE88DRAFT_1732481 [Heliocybe sulcata]